VDAVEIANRAAAGEAMALAALDRYEDRLARALTTVVNLVDPDVIVLGGGLSNIERLYTDVPALWGSFVFACGARDARVRTQLLRAKYGASSGVRGASWLWS